MKRSSRHQKFNMAPAIIGGSSSGARLALTFALRHPQSVRALILWRVTGGGFAVKRLAERYYDQYVRLAGEGGMAAVCAEEHFAELIRNRGPWAGVTDVYLMGALEPTHAVDVTDTLPAGVDSLRAHQAYLDGLGRDFDPDQFLRAVTTGAGRARLRPRAPAAR